jgi:transcriptional regulator with XRE-family HTH domain
MRTPKGRALGRALRDAREASGRKLRAFAEELGLDPGLLSRWETGERAPRPEQVAQILTRLGVNGERFDEIIALAQGIEDPRWLALTLPEQHQQFSALLELEEMARRITHVGPLLVPGLLQTNDYIRTIMSSPGGAPPGEVAARVAVRVGRKQVLSQSGPPQLHALIGEAALVQLVGTPAIMAEQLRHLVSMSQWSNVDIQVGPFDSGWHPGLEGPFVLIEPKQATPVVQLESRRSLLLLHEEADVDPYHEAAELVAKLALDQDDTRQLIAEHADRWEKAR